jgi:hypothetical protein
MADLPGQRVAGARLQGEGSDHGGLSHRPGVVFLVAELSGHERQAAEELGQWKTRVEERMPLEPARRWLRSPCC